MPHSAYRFCINYLSHISILGFLLVIACISIVLIGDLRLGLFDPNGYLPDRLSNLIILPDALLIFWGPFAAAFIVYAVAVIFQVRSDIPLARKQLWLILFVAFFCRVIMLFSPPTLSDDIYRYLWDANMQFQGINPYVHAPGSEAIAHLRDDYHSGINNQEVPTIYPPLMQVAFAIAAYLWYSPTSMKIFFTLCDMGVILFIMLLLRNRNFPENRVLVYAWNPLVLVEIAGSGHNDSLAVLLMFAALLAVDRYRHTQGVFWLTLSMLAKWFTVMLVPTFIRQFKNLKPFLILPVLVFVLFLPYMDAGPKLFTGLLVYGAKWRFNDSLFSILFYLTDSLDVAKGIVITMFACVVLYCTVKIEDPVRSAFILLGAYLMLTPVLQPWYLVWIIPFLCIFPNPAWILFSGLSALSYHVGIQFILEEIWCEKMWVRYVEYVPFYSLLIVQNVWGQKRWFRTQRTIQKALS